MKSGGDVIVRRLDTVAPYTGAWIEIWPQVCGSFSGTVAPYTGAWIEIMMFTD
ncbi:hypothetical protein [Caproicibacterium sp. XB2]|uniref:hypothetical protein n=1 Tax=Caproicibacterium sp. XB2 TaxID=3388458 RepID=UPI00384C4797